MKINNSILNTKSPNFKGFNLSPLSKALYTLSNNDMLNASFIDIFAMDTPRTIVEFKNRGKNAGIEMGFREYTGTFIAEFSATVFALLFSKLFAKKNKNINPNSWATNSSIDTLTSIYESSTKNPKDYVNNVLNSMQGLVGGDWVNFKNEKGNSIVGNITNLNTDKSLNKKSQKSLLGQAQDEIISILKADNNISIKNGQNEFSANLSHILRDVVDMGKNVFFNDKIDYTQAIDKLKTLNKSRILFALPLSMALAITNQYINRKLTKKRTGIDNFVGENDYQNNVDNKKETKKEKGLLLKKILSAGVFLFMLKSVMDIKKPEDLIKKLSFDGPATSGNLIKTIYGTLILGRIFASKDSTELRETNVRDYLGFLSWLVLGGFVAKGGAQIMDMKQANLFNIKNSGNKGIWHWLKDVSLKSQKEIIASGVDVKNNLRKLNIAQLMGIGYSAVMLGVLLPKLNIWMTKRKKTKPENKSYSVSFTMNDFMKQTKNETKIK